MPNDHALYCTGEIMDITPLRISKFNELGEDNVYFRNYSVAIANIKKYGTDMWNPHLGNNLHKRGYLPYMNEAMEHECDVKVVKALLFGFQNGRIVYKDGMGEANNLYYFERDGRKITDSEGRWINNKNIAQLMSWMRNEDELVEKWSALFDREITRQKHSLPNLASENTGEIRTLEAALTATNFMKMITGHLYEDPSEKSGKGSKKAKLADGKLSTTQRVGPTAIEFAYMIKTSEESGRDCDDAERILTVIYDTFKELCEYRTNPELTPECFIQVYKQQLGNVYEALATSKTVVSAESDCKAHFKQLTTWLSQADVFSNISSDTPMDEKGKVCINCAFSEKDSNDVKRILEFVATGMKKPVEKDDQADEPKEAAADQVTK